MPAPQEINFRIENGDILGRRGDVLALKHADGLYGVDEIVYQRLSERSGSPPRLPKIDGFSLHPSGGVITASKVLFVGVGPLRKFGYEEIRSFGHRVLSCLAGALPEARTVLLTVHGPGYGLDEAEAFSAQLSGLIDAISTGDSPSGLKEVVIVELNRGRSIRLQQVLESILASRSVPHGSLALEAISDAPKERLRTAGAGSASKPAVFVAMPFAKEFEDVFYYGIEGAVHAAGYLCERSDLASFTGDVLRWVQERISRATLVIGDLTGGNPNVYLEVGYAWGRNIPTVLLIKKSEELKFDVRGQRCLVYDTIRSLEEKLSTELRRLTSGAE